MGALVQREVLPSLILSSPKGYSISVSKDNPIRETWMGIYFNNNRIGFSNTVVSEDISDGVCGYKISESSVIKLSMLGEDRVVKLRGNSFFDEALRLKNFDYRIESGQHRLMTRARLEKDRLKLKIDSGGEIIERELILDERTLISNSLSPFFAFRKLDKDTKELTLSIFDPITMGKNSVKIKKIGEGTIKIDGAQTPCDIIETDLLGVKTKSWISKDGEILREESSMGWTMIKEPSHKAVSLIATRELKSQDILSEVSISSNLLIPNPGEVSFLKIEIKKNGEIQILEIYKDLIPQSALSIPIEDIQEEIFVQSKDKRIGQLAKEIVGEEKDSWTCSKKILNWVFKNIKKSPTLSIPSALEVLKIREGDCNEHTVLFTALTRALGIPTKMVAGLVYFEGRFFYHAWPKVYVGTWIDVDPTIGQEIADATHIPLVEGGLLEQIEIAKTVGKLQVEILEYRNESKPALE